jgi:hypothetical protein
MKDEKDWGPADYWAQGQMIGGGIAVLVVFIFVVAGWVIHIIQ